VFKRENGLNAGLYDPVLGINERVELLFAAFNLSLSGVVFSEIVRISTVRYKMP
jgi:hypothetical protein